MNMSKLWYKNYYEAPFRCLIDVQIREYDISKANISVLFQKGLISKDLYEKLYSADKMYREIYMGKLKGNNPELSRALSDGIRESKKRFFEMNGISDSEVLRVANDAVYIVGNKPITNQQVFDYVYFKHANTYREYFKIKNLLFFYNADVINKTEVLDIKGLGDDARALHENYMIDFLKEFFYSCQVNGIQYALVLLKNFYMQYANRQLPIGYYRELNGESKYSFIHCSNYATFKIDHPGDNMLNYIDIGYNARVLSDIASIMANIYLGNQKF